MTITLDIPPDVEAELARQAAAQGRAIEVVAAALLEGAVNPKSAQRATCQAEPAQPERRTGRALIDASAKVRGLLTDEEVDTLFRRNPSFARPVDFE